MNEHKYVLKNNNAYVGGKVGTYAENGKFGIVQFYGDISDAALMDSETAHYAYDLLISNFPSLEVVPAKIVEADGTRHGHNHEETKQKR